MSVIYTIGYTAFEPEAFLKAIQELAINCVVDVRTTPMSAYAPQYNRSVLEKQLKAHGILYRNYQEFGARQTDRSYYPKGYLDFEEYAQSDAFQTGMRKIIAGINMGYRFVLLCAEKDPMNCHRSILVARAFANAGYSITHIRPKDDGSGYDQESQQALEKRLMKECGDDPEQESMLDSYEERIAKAYRYMNERIGFRAEEE